MTASHRHITIALLLLTLSAVSMSAYPAVVTYVINSRTSVRPDGSEPIGSFASYSQTSSTGKIGQLTAGNCARFSIISLPELIIQDITMQIHSNTSAGSGRLELRRNTTLVASIDDDDFCSEAWNGKYSTAFTPISVDIDGYLHIRKGDSLSVSICASANSLYVSELTITYSLPNTTAYTVSFSTGIEHTLSAVRESAPNAGVVLPDLAASYPDMATSMPEWLFMGWVQKLADQVGQCPEYQSAGTRFYPRENTMLYALYSDSLSFSRQWVQDTVFASGDYVFADTWYHACAQGGLNTDGKINSLMLPPWQFTDDSLRYTVDFIYPDDAVYHIEFLSDSLATITNLHDNDKIGYASTSALRLSKANIEWNYTIYPDHQIAFYHTYPKNTRYLRADVGETQETADILSFAAYTYVFNDYATILFNIADAPEIRNVRYTSHPLSSAIDDLEDSQIFVTAHGVSNPNNLPLRLLAVSGVVLLDTTNDITFSQLPAGVYVLCYGGHTRKLFLP